MSALKSLTPHQALWLSVAAAIVTIGLKWMAYWITGSVGFLSDALESLVNLAGASFALVMVLYAQQPADPGHPFGHSKAEYFASAFEGVLIAVAAIAIMIAAVQRIREPQPLESLGLGTAFSVAASLVNLAVARILLHVGKAHRSLATQADGRHLMTDVWTTVGVIVGVGLAGLTGWYVLDPVVAILVAANILREGYRLVRRSVDGLMDAALSEQDIRAIEQALERLAPREGRFTNLRTRRAGAVRFAQAELRVPEDWTVGRAHALGLAAEQALAEQAITLRIQVIPEPATEHGAKL